MSEHYDDGDNLLEILSELETLLSTARTMPMSASVIVNREEALELIDRAREALPASVTRAEGIVAQVDHLRAQGLEQSERSIAHAREEAERIIAHAHDETERLVASENVVRQANERADEIIAAAEAQAAAQRAGADEYAARSLDTLQEQLERMSAQVAAGQALLAERMGTLAEPGAQASRSGASSAARAQAHASAHSDAPASSRPTQSFGPGSVNSPRTGANWSVDPSAQR